MSTPPQRILIADRAYTAWSFENADFSPPEGFHPAIAKLFTKDVVVVNDDNILTLLHSPTRTLATHAGVLQLSEHRTFGRKGKRLLYKCIPDDKYLPAFLIPYELQIGFSKTVSNKFVVFAFDSWNDKHPHGQLVETLGDVSALEAFYEYQLYCKSLHDNMKRATQDARRALHRASIDSYTSEICTRHACSKQDDQTICVFSIDPQNSLDFDDAMSITMDPDNPRVATVSIYIANVAFWIEALELWNSLTNRVATIYLPDRRRPMLPTVLSDSLCSLQEKQDRFAFVCDFRIDSGHITSASFRHCLVRVAHNYRYEENRLVACPHYQELLQITRQLDASCKDSHDVVSYWMIATNGACARHMTRHHVGGIFRVKEAGNTMGNYVQMEELPEMVPEYVHMTSPIRRLVDLLNQIVFFNHILGIVLSDDAQRFLTTWVDKMDYINASMRSIRKVQNECQLVLRCHQQPHLLDMRHTGVVYDRIERISGFFHYTVHLESLQLLTRLQTTQNLENHSTVECKLVVFENEEKTKRKIRVTLLSV